MNKIFLLLLAIGLFFWMHKPSVSQQSLAASDQLAFSTTAPPPISAPAGHILEISIPAADMDFYDVEGGSAEEIRANLNRRHANGGFDGYTGWQVNWRWPGIGQSDCDLSAATLDTSIRVRLPRWQPPRDADPALILKWNSYLGNLAYHEQGHVQLARQGFAKMQQTLQNSTCDQADANLNVVLSEMRQADLRYDAETRHGSTQGAKFP